MLNFVKLVIYFKFSFIDVKPEFEISLLPIYNSDKLVTKCKLFDKY